MFAVDYSEIQIGDLIGRGSYGTVHKGVWNGETVALKQVSIPAGIDAKDMLANNKELAALRYRTKSVVVSHCDPIL